MPVDLDLSFLIRFLDKDNAILNETQVRKIGSACVLVEVQYIASNDGDKQSQA